MCRLAKVRETKTKWLTAVVWVPCGFQRFTPSPVLYMRTGLVRWRSTRDRPWAAAKATIPDTLGYWPMMALYRGDYHSTCQRCGFSARVPTHVARFQRDRAPINGDQILPKRQKDGVDILTCAVPNRLSQGRGLGCMSRRDTPPGCRGQTQDTPFLFPPDERANHSRCFY